MKPKIRKITPKDLKALNTGGPLVSRYPPGGTPARLFKPKLTSRIKPDEKGGR